MEQVRKDAEKTVQVASVNRLKKQKEQEALEREIEQFRRTEGKYMHEAQRALKEAMITQKYIDRDDD
jgi:predicted  nucleic acid-binding Zn-ribbon protein